MPYARRTDGNHASIVQTFRKVGWLVIDTSSLGRGFPDLVIAKAGRVELIEVKDGTKPASARALTAAEQRFADDMTRAGITVHVVASIEQAARL